jgi:hypothetical protein
MAVWDSANQTRYDVRWHQVRLIVIWNSSESDSLACKTMPSQTQCHVRQCAVRLVAMQDSGKSDSLPCKTVMSQTHGQVRQQWVSSNSLPCETVLSYTHYHVKQQGVILIAVWDSTKLDSLSCENNDETDSLPCEARRVRFIAMWNSGKSDSVPCETAMIQQDYTVTKWYRFQICNHITAPQSMKMVSLAKLLNSNGMVQQAIYIITTFL